MKRLVQRLILEALEDRTLMSTCHVTRLSDIGAGMGFRGDLRYCINKVNSVPGKDAIDFHVTGTINLTGALPNLVSDMSIQGPGALQLTVRRNSGGDYRVFTVNSGAVVQIDGLSISNGNANFGGGIYNDSSLSLTNCKIANNTATNGGGVYNDALGWLTVANSTIADNLAYRFAFSDDEVGGGAIFNNDHATVVIDSSTISNNVARIEGDAETFVRGGGIRNTGSLTINNSTISENLAEKVGTTFGYASGGGIWNWGSLLLAHSTIANNAASSAGSTGGGIDTGCGCSQSDLSNNILSGNTAEKGPDLKGAMTSSGYNLFGNSGYVFNSSSTDLLNLDPKLGPLADNGGPTQTMSLLPGSPAIDSGDNTNAPDWDQRGPGFPRIVNGTIDRGAFEAQATGAPLPANPLAALITADFQTMNAKRRR